MKDVHIRFKDELVIFYLPDGQKIRARLDRGQLYLMGVDGTIVVRPEVSNVIWVASESRLKRCKGGGE